MKVTVKDLRTKLGLPQPEFGQLLGVHPITVSRWERGTLKPNAYQQALMAEFGKAAKKKDTAEELKNLIFTAGVVAALYFLLKAASK